MNLSRRSFLAGAAGLIAAPAIVRIESLMPVRQRLVPLFTTELGEWRNVRFVAPDTFMFSDELSDVLRQAVTPRTRFRQLIEVSRDARRKRLPVHLGLRASR